MSGTIYGAIVLDSGTDGPEEEVGGECRAGGGLSGVVGAVAVGNGPRPRQSESASLDRRAVVRANESSVGYRQAAPAATPRRSTVPDRRAARRGSKALSRPGPYAAERV